MAKVTSVLHGDPPNFGGIYCWLVVNCMDIMVNYGYIYIFWVVVYLLLWKIWKSNGMIIPNIWKNKSHVPNHQPDIHKYSEWHFLEWKITPLKIRPWSHLFFGCCPLCFHQITPLVVLVIYTLWLFNIAMENGPFIDGLPIKNGDFPWLC